MMNDLLVHHSSFIISSIVCPNVMTTVLTTTLSVVGVLMVAVWLLSLFKKDASIVDGFWGLGFVAIAVSCYLAADGYHSRKTLITTLTAVWGIRLAIHILWRNFGKGEDFRYQAMRKRFGKRFPIISLFTVFGLQGVLMWIVSLPIQIAEISPEPRRLLWLDWLGASLWLIGFLFESIGDLQLTLFRVNPSNKGKVMDRGLWRYTRHPNYFGDAVMWWGLFVIAMAAPGGWWTVIGPLIMTGLLMKVSGVALLEKTLTKTKPEYASYIQRTNAFFPWLPAKR